jgi:linoleoyl-CoA desaturase
MITPKFSMPSSSFYGELRKRVNTYFKENNISPTGNYKLYTKATLVGVLFVATYTHLVFFTPNYWLAALECIFLGGLTALIGFNVMHDGAHGSFSNRKWINTVAGASINFLGANVYLWKTKHNIIHHTYTNIDGIDDDIDAGVVLRLAETQKKYGIHRIQHWYFILAYSLLYFYWIFFTDIKNISLVK